MALVAGSSARLCLAALTVVVVVALAAPPQPPAMPQVFSAIVHYNDTDGPQVFRHYFDAEQSREAQLFSVPAKESALFFYHKPVKGCMDDNSCATIYNIQGAECDVSNTSNTMDRFLGWLKSDEFTKQPARYLGHDAAHNCSLWEHVSKGFYPAPFNETVCVREAGGFAEPVYKSWTDGGEPGSTTHWSGKQRP